MQEATAALAVPDDAGDGGSVVVAAELEATLEPADAGASLEVVGAVGEVALVGGGELVVLEPAASSVLPLLDSAKIVNTSKTTAASPPPSMTRRRQYT